MSADSEIIALTALGVSRQRMLVPVGVLALTGAIATGTLTLWLAPAAFRGLRGIKADLLASQPTFQIQPRVFDDRFPKRVVNAREVSATAARRPCGRLHFVGAADRDVLLADRGWRGICTGRKTESVDRNLAGKYWPDHSCHYFAAADGTVARGSWVAPQSHPAGNLETVYAP